MTETKKPAPVYLHSDEHWAEVKPCRWFGYLVWHVSSGGLTATIGSWWCPTRRWAEWKGRRLCAEHDRIHDKSETYRVRG